MTDRELRLRLRIDRLLDQIEQLKQTVSERDETIEECRNGRKYWWNRASKLERRLAVREAREKKR